MGLFGLFSSRKSSTNQTSTSSNYNDNRQVNDAGGGVVGSGNWQDNSTNTSTFADFSQYWADQSNRSNNWSNSVGGDDRSNRSTNIITTTNTTDGGAFDAMQAMGLAQTEAARAIGLRAFDSTDRMGIASINAAQRAQESAMSTIDGALSKFLNFAESGQAEAYKSSREALGFQMQGFGQLAKLSGDLVQAATAQTAKANDQAKAAYQGAADSASGNRTLLLAALAAVAVVAVVAFNKG